MKNESMISSEQRPISEGSSASKNENDESSTEARIKDAVEQYLANSPATLHPSIQALIESSEHPGALVNLII